MAKPKILLLDPDLKNRSVLEISLKKSGFTVTCGEDALQALEIIETFNPELIISEISLADKDGFWLCSQLLEKYHDQRPPFIFLTKHKRVEDKIRGLELGVEDYLVKPIYLREVVARVRILIEKKGKIQSAQAKPSGPLFQGDLEEMGVVDLLQTMELGNKTGIIQITHPRQNAQIFVQSGRVVHSVVGSFVGERAIYKMMQWTEGSFRIDFKKTIQVQPTISVGTQGLIMEGVRRIDEIERVKEQLPVFTARLVIDSAIILEEHPDRFPAKIENILAEFDGQKSIEEVVESLPYDDLESLEVIGKLFFQGFLIEASESLEELEPDEEIISGTAASQPVMGRDAPMLSSFGTIDLDNLDLGSSTSIEGIKEKARKPGESTSGKKSVSRKAPVFDSLPGFDLAPPSERIVVAPTKRKKEISGKSESDPKSVSLSSTRSSRKQRIITNLDAGIPLAPPIVPPTMASEEMETRMDSEETGLAPPVVPPDAVPAQEQSASKMRMDRKKLKEEKTRSTRKKQPGKVTIASELAEPIEMGNVLAVAPSPALQDAPPEQMQPAARAAPPHRERMPLIAATLGVMLLAGAFVFWYMNRTVKGPSQYLLEAQKALEAGQLTVATQEAGKALALAPGMAQARIVLARAARQGGRLQEAVNQYRTALAMEPSLYADRLKYARVLYDQQEAGSNVRALSEANRLLLDLSPLRERDIYVNTLVFKLKILGLMGRRAEMRVAVGQLQAVSPADPQLPLFERQLEDMAGRDQPKQLKAAASVSVPSPTISKPVRKPVAKALPKKVAKLRPVVRPKTKRRTIQKQHAKPKGPTPEEQRRLQARAKYKKGLALYRKGYLKSSERELRGALALEPDNGEVLIDLGRVYSELGQDRLALKQFMRATRVDPRNPRSYINLGSVYMLMNNRHDAVQAYETYVRLMPGASKEAREVEKILVKLRSSE